MVIRLWFSLAHGTGLPLACTCAPLRWPAPPLSRSRTQATAHARARHRREAAALACPLQPLHHVVDFVRHDTTLLLAVAACAKLPRALCHRRRVCLPLCCLALACMGLCACGHTWPATAGTWPCPHIALPCVGLPRLHCHHIHAWCNAARLPPQIGAIHCGA